MGFIVTIHTYVIILSFSFLEVYPILIPHLMAKDVEHFVKYLLPISICIYFSLLFTFFEKDLEWFVGYFIDLTSFKTHSNPSVSVSQMLGCFLNVRCESLYLVPLMYFLLRDD